MKREPIVHLPPFRVEATFAALSETVDWSLATYNVPSHWKETRGAGVRVAVLDTGIDADHADLADAIEAERDFTGGRSGSLDRQGHGTHTAGIIAARRNGVGVIGVANQCRLLVGKVLGDDGSGDASRVAAGVRWAVDQKADIISMSLGSNDASRDLAAAIEEAIAAGVFIICAAGNAGRPNSVQFPARLDAAIAVGAVDRNGRVSSFSSRGDEVDLCAPGEDILSTYPGGYAKLSGTSMAAPFVAGVTALLVARHRHRQSRTPLVSQADLVEHLRRTAIDAGAAGKDPNYGYGLINPDSLLRDEPSPADAAPPIADFRLGPIEINGRRGMLVFVQEGEPRT